ncbi:hypothetical protein [Anaerorhabdus furcosa]|uniref:Uncharacterized protein n=1 Tax=Anaerorhabdus furcosa TaxID=118967 RepID=A0A1T4JYK3_9FIRM|nr:hypothetical protein [Anaerorhabdus furcosa]SJZ35260.1 hypothetical protein SAMN02745191_0176 [Anaerorhabdus furcosa]
MRNSKNFGLSVGYSSILIVFVILVFVSFSTLSYKQAETSLNRVNKSIAILTENYDADTKAMEVRYEIDQILARSNSMDEAKIILTNTLDNINLLDNTVDYTIMINDNARLEVKLNLNVEEMNSEILSWIVVTNNEGDYSQKGFNF